MTQTNVLLDHSAGSLEVKTNTALKGKKVFVTGGAGFIGTSFISRLVGENTVVAFDNHHRNALSGSGLEGHENLRLIRGDVLDLPALKEATGDADIVVHLAAIAGVDTVMAHLVRTLRTNLLGTNNVLEACLGLPKLERLVCFSSSEVFGKHAYKVEETHTTSQGAVGEARWTYAVSKLAGEYLAHAYSHEFGLPVVIIRPFNVYGPGQVGEGAIHKFIVNALRGEDLVIHGDGCQIRAWCYVDDIVDALLLCIEREQAVGNVFNIGNPSSTVTVCDLAEQVLVLTGSESKTVFRPIHYEDIEIRVPSIQKARQALDFQPKVGLKEGLRRTIEWYRSRLGSGGNGSDG